MDQMSSGRRRSSAPMPLSPMNVVTRVAAPPVASPQPRNPPSLVGLVNTQSVRNNAATAKSSQLRTPPSGRSFDSTMKKPVTSSPAGAATALRSDTVNSELLAAFECPICMDYISPPYLQCPDGHMICEGCRQRVAQCPSCRGPVPNIRNLAMDRIAATLKFPCKYAGCKQALVPSNKIAHETTCDFKAFTCPALEPDCKWEGTAAGVMAHLTEKHPALPTLEGDSVVFGISDVLADGSVDWLLMQKCFGRAFMVVLQKRDLGDIVSGRSKMYTCVVQLIGTKAEADRFKYKLEISNGHRRMSWEDITQSTVEKASVIVYKCQCLTFNATRAQMFADSNKQLNIHVVIEKLKSSKVPQTAAKKMNSHG